MDYIEAFKNLKTNNKYSRKSPHKAILLLTVIEMYETNVLSDNIILYDDELKRTFQKVWERTLKDDPLFHAEAYFPFWYMQSEDFWHIVPVRGKEDILTLLRDNHVKPSEAKLKDCVKYAELDEDLYFLMTLPTGRSSLKRALLETYTNLPEEKIKWYSISLDNTIDSSLSALADYKMILSQKKEETKIETEEADDKLVCQFKKLNEDIQIVLNLQYFSFLKSHRREREMFKEICPTVFDLLDKIINHPVKQGEISPSLAFTYDNFLSDLKISLMTEQGAMEIIDKIGEAIDILRGNNQYEKEFEPIEEDVKEHVDYESPKEVFANKLELPSDELEIEHVYLDSRGKILYTTKSTPDIIPERDFATENRKGKPWTINEEKQIQNYYQQGLDIKTISAIIGRTEIAIKSRLAKLGLMEYTYGQEEKTISKTIVTEQKKVEHNHDISRIINSPLYVVRKQAILRAMGFYRLPVDIKNITRTISRTAWGTTIKENDVKEIIDTLSEVETVEGKYILRKKR